MTVLEISRVLKNRTMESSAPRMLVRMFLRWSLLLICTFPLFAAIDSITITELAGVTTKDYPVQLGRAFVEGEITNYPAAVLNGAALTTQADVKNRWPGGSVKFAILTFLIPSLGANSTVTVEFKNQPTGNNIGYLDDTAMLAQNYDFDARLELTNGTTQVASARAMLSAHAYSYWLQGSVATSVVLADHSGSRSFDIGFDNNKSFRPIFHATFWPGINRVRIRFIGENANTEALQDITYALALKIGAALPSTVYTHPSFTHRAATRWTRDRGNQPGQTWPVRTPGGNITVEKEIWIGGAPPPIQINHNLAYLTATKAVYNYDTSIQVPEAAIANVYAEYARSAKDINDPGSMTTAMGSAGGRYDIGPFDSWSMFYLYSGDVRMREVSFRNADLAGGYSDHYREGKTDRNITRTALRGCAYACDSNGTGKILSVTGRPTVRTMQSYWSTAQVSDRILPVGTVADPSPWVVSATHLQEYQAVPYILSGDFWYLEELQFLASWAITWQPATGSWGRGTNGWEGAQTNDVEPRVVAWTIRTRAHAAYFSPDNTAEKSYFETGLKDAFADMEGEHNITGTALYNDPFFRTIWNFGKARNANINYSAEGSPAAWNAFDHGAPSASWCQYDKTNADGSGSPASDCADTYSMQSPWMTYYTIVGLGRAKELGYASDAMLTYMSGYLNGMLTNPNYNPWLIGEYHVSTLKNSPRRWYSSWAEVKATYLEPTRSRANFLQGVTPDAYPYYAFAAASYTADKANGAAAWSWLNTNVRRVGGGIEMNPTWAILPRSAVVAPPANPCDLDGSGTVDLGDVQIAIDQALSRQVCGSAALINPSVCTAVEVQRVINAIHGACVVGQ